MTLDEALATCGRLNHEGVLATLDHLGESVTSLTEAEASREAYLAALDRIAERGLDSSISVKLTQLGLNLSEQQCRANVQTLIERAQAKGNIVEIDMESSEYVERTLGIVSDFRQGSVRAVIQAYLYRSENDLQELCRRFIPVRLVKGAYQEPADVAFPKKSDVDSSYAHLMIQLLDSGVNPAIATHDEKILQTAIEYVQKHKISASRFEFQMLYGVRRDLQRRLAAEGYRVRLYVPYGNAWYPYFMRRLAERPANLLFLLRNLMRN